MAAFAKYLELSKMDWLDLCVEAYGFCRSPEFMTLWQALTGLAEYHPTIGEEGLALAQSIASRYTPGLDQGEGRAA